MAKYGKNWGSVSTNFTRTTGFTSETQRISKQAEDQYRKEKDQLGSMKEAASFESRQARTSAAMADKTSAYELKALSKFSGKLNTFLQGTAAEWYKENDAKDLKKKIIDRKANLAEWNKKRLNLEETIKGISNNTERVEELQEELKKHNLLDPNSSDNIAKLSGNEKLAYYSITSQQKVDGAEAGYYNYIDSHAEREVTATWLPKEKVKNENGVEREQYQKIKIGAITTPEGKQFLKDEYLASVLKDSPMGGLKSDYRMMLLAEPLNAALDKIQATDVQSYKQDQARQRFDAGQVALKNRILATPPYDADDIENMGAELNAALALTRTTYPATGDGNPRDGFDQVVEGMLENVTSLTDKNKMTVAFDRLLKMGDVVITSGPNKGKTFAKAYPNRWDVTAMTKKMHNALATVKGRKEKESLGQVTRDVELLSNQINKGIASKTEALSPAQAKVEAEKGWTALFKKYEGNEYALAKLTELQGSATIGFTDQNWEDKFVDLGGLHRGVVPKAALGDMPQDLANELSKKYGWDIVEQVPGQSTKAEQELNKLHTGTVLTKAINDSQRLNGQTKSDQYTAVMIDLAGDKYQELVNRYVLQGDENGKKLSPRAAMNRAVTEVTAMIKAGSGGDEVARFLEDGRENPFFAQRSNTQDGLASAWTSNPEAERHIKRGLQLLGPNKRLENGFNEKVKEKADNKQPINFKTDWMWPPVGVDKETGRLTDEKQIAHLGTGDDATPGRVITDAYNKLTDKQKSSLKPPTIGNFIHSQRVALLLKTSKDGDPSTSVLWKTHGKLLEQWFTYDGQPGTTLTNRRNEEAAQEIEAQPDFAEQAQGVQEDYGTRRGIFGRNPALSQQQAEDVVSGRGNEWTTDDPI